MTLMAEQRSVTAREYAGGKGRRPVLPGAVDRNIRDKVVPIFQAIARRPVLPGAPMSPRPSLSGEASCAVGRLPVC